LQLGFGGNHLQFVTHGNEALHIGKLASYIDTSLGDA
jgi:hypothetical protein